MAFIFFTVVCLRLPEVGLNLIHISVCFVLNIIMHSQFPHDISALYSKSASIWKDIEICIGYTHMSWVYWCSSKDKPTKANNAGLLGHRNTLCVFVPNMEYVISGLWRCVWADTRYLNHWLWLWRSYWACPQLGKRGDVLELHHFSC